MRRSVAAKHMNGGHFVILMVLGEPAENGMHPGDLLSEEDVAIWSDFLRKRGWRDSPAVLADLEDSKKQSGLEHRTELDTYFRFNDADEGRELLD